MNEGQLTCQPFCTVAQFATMIGTNVATVLQYANRRDDPLPIRYIQGKQRGGVLRVAEADEWLVRNTVLYGDR